MTRATLLTLLLPLLACILAACGRPSPASLPAPVESAGAAAPRPRIVALSPAIAVALRDIGQGDLIVGRHGFDAWTDQAVPVCGDQSGVDYESLLVVNPTHVLVQWGQRDVPARLTELASRHGWTVRSFNPLSLDEVRAMAVALWREFAPPPPASAPAEPATEPRNPDWLVRLDASWRAAPDTDLSGAGRVLLLHGVSPPNALGPGSFHVQVLERLGAAPAITDGSPYITLDVEDVLHLRPDVIVLLAPRPPGSAPAISRTGPVPAAELAAALGPLATLDVPAVQHGRVAVIDDPECLLPSTSLVRFADDLARLLAPWAADQRAPRGGG